MSWGGGGVEGFLREGRKRESWGFWGEGRGGGSVEGCCGDIDLKWRGNICSYGGKIYIGSEYIFRDENSPTMWQAHWSQLMFEVQQIGSQFKKGGECDLHTRVTNGGRDGVRSESWVNMWPPIVVTRNSLMNSWWGGRWDFKAKVLESKNEQASKEWLLQREGGGEGWVWGVELKAKMPSSWSAMTLSILLRRERR